MATCAQNGSVVQCGATPIKSFRNRFTTPNSEFNKPRHIMILINPGMVYGISKRERISFLNGNSLSLNIIAMASPNANVDSTLTVGKMKFQLTICTKGPRNAGLVAKSLKFFRPTVVRKPGLMVLPSLVVNVPWTFAYTSPFDCSITVSVAGSYLKRGSN